ncbi:helix-turn-helix transcriptional regulator [Gemmiger formicilis]|uniref:response regulator transcription factor n=1 Tax=Gemmiger formicilis TaxID=745368 RepID=UPI00195A4EC4|nr:helix-turn-helix transcriptional regulator [Gemmiger formicilis]MBM6900539.1 helix-turn-helix transcriptional regulator [Gemmiger formicilis]
MNYQGDNRMNFFSELSEHQISADEFFNVVLLDSLARNFGLQNVLISYFDTQGNFLSWTHRAGVLADGPEHPYRRVMAQDTVRQVLYREAVRDHLTYNNMTPRLYRSTDLIPADGYDADPYVRFLEEQFRACYSVTMAFGINAYIQVAFFKSRAEGDFTPEEMAELGKIYVYIANDYKNFKKYEQAKIVANIQSEIILSGEKAYLVTDDFHHVMSCNEAARSCLRDILGQEAVNGLKGGATCSWLPFLLGDDADYGENHVQTRVIRHYVFKIYTYDQRYFNGIVDRYHWITIAPQEPAADSREPVFAGTGQPLTKTEWKVARLLHKGLTYQAVADELVISYHTVKKHVQNIYTKCGVNTRFQLYKWLEHNDRGS